MLETVFANVVKQRLKLRHMSDGAVAEGLQLVIGRRALADIAANDAFAVVSGKAGIRERPGGRSTFHRAVGVLNAERASQDGRVGNFGIGRQRLGPVAAV